jgi:hypothetical protein
MSFLNARILHESDYGLPKEYIDKIIVSENLKEITDQFVKQTKPICKKFGSVSTIRIVAFNQKSGMDDNSKVVFDAFIRSERNVFYAADMSNKECCVVFVQDPKGISALDSTGVLAHEFAHHFQFAHAGFPFYSFKAQQSEGAPLFVKLFEIGSPTGSAKCDNLPLPCIEVVIEDSSERVSDIICEGLLRERKLTGALDSRYLANVLREEDPALCVQGPVLKRYVHRLALRDLAEWGACVKLAFPDMDASLLSKTRKRARNVNKKYLNAHLVFDSIFKLCSETDFNSFKEPTNTLAYMREVFNLLNIKVNPPI